MGTKEHKAGAPRQAKIGILSVSTTRSLAQDQSGKWMCKQAIKEGHVVVAHEVIPDDAAQITATVQKMIDELELQVLLMSGGTGIGPQDVTIEAVRPLYKKELSAFGVLFAMLSFEEIDSAAFLSRATAGIIGQTIVFNLPGSLKACKLACRNLIFPELDHIIKHLQE